MTDTIEIHKADISDIPRIQQIANITWPVTFKDILSQEQIKYMMEMMYSVTTLSEQIVTKNHVFLLACQGNQDLAFTSYELNYNGTASTKIHKIYILPTAQGKGIGKLLINKIAAIAKNNLNNTLSLNVNRDNKAISFYEKMNFRIVKEENIDIGQGFLMEDYVMEKLL